MSRFLVRMGLCCLLVFPVLVHATTSIPAISTSLFAEGAGPTNATYGLLTNSKTTPTIPPPNFLPGGTINDSAFISFSGGDMTATATADSSGGPILANSSATGDFFFEVVGPGSGMVPLNFVASGTTMASGPAANANAIATVNSTVLGAPASFFLKVFGCSDTAGPCGPTGFSGAVPFTAPVGAIGDVSIEVTCEAGGNSVTGVDGTCGASIDPMIQIDPSFANAGAYSLIFSPDGAPITPPGVPEPGSLVLLGSGMLGIYGFARRKMFQ